jgi:hypothetical protein
LRPRLPVLHPRHCGGKAAPRAFSVLIV